jgi:hypothetical protein
MGSGRGAVGLDDQDQLALGVPLRSGEEHPAYAAPTRLGAGQGDRGLARRHLASFLEWAAWSM